MKGEILRTTHYETRALNGTTERVIRLIIALSRHSWAKWRRRRAISSARRCTVRQLSDETVFELLYDALSTTPADFVKDARDDDFYWLHIRKDAYIVAFDARVAQSAILIELLP